MANELRVLNDLSDQIVYWYHAKQNRAHARDLLERFQQLLSGYSEDSESTTIQQFWSLYYEIKGDLNQAIHHKILEISSIKTLLSMDGGTDHESYASLADTNIELAWLLLESGDVPAAKATVQLAHSIRLANGEDNGDYSIDQIIRLLDRVPLPKMLAG